jgi:autotransporter family porin
MEGRVSPATAKTRREIEPPFAPTLPVMGPVFVVQAPPELPPLLLPLLPPLEPPDPPEEPPEPPEEPPDPPELPPDPPELLPVFPPSVSNPGELPCAPQAT